MARSVATDFFQNMYFLVRAQTPNGVNLLDRPQASGVDAPAGFASCSLPSVSNDPVEYREGTFIYTRKQPGIPSMDQISLTRGVARLDSALYAWMRIANEGQGDYRADVTIDHYHRAVSLTRFSGTGGKDPTGGKGISAGSNLTKIDANASPGRTYHVGECWPSMVKVGGDLDGTSSDISMQEIQLEYEFVEVQEYDF